jgi:hypothetical protein
MRYVTRMAGAAFGAAMVIGSSLLVPPAQAFTITMQEQGQDVVVGGSGVINPFDLIVRDSGQSVAGTMVPKDGNFTFGQAPGNNDIDLFGDDPNGAPNLAKLTGPTSFGAGGFVVSNDGNGDPVGIVHNTAGVFLVLPHDFDRGAFLDVSNVFPHVVINALGVTPGTYKWTWGDLEDESLTLIIGPNGAVEAVPEPASLALLGTNLAALLGLVSVVRRRGR